MYLKLFSLGSINRASTCTSAALDALICVDLVLTVCFSDAAYGTFVSTSTTSDAIIRNLICHFKYTSVL